MRSYYFCPPHAPGVDYQFAFVEEAIALGTDAIAMTISVGDDDQGREITMLAQLVREALPFGLPVVAHIYAIGYDRRRFWEAVGGGVPAGWRTWRSWLMKLELLTV